MPALMHGTGSAVLTKREREVATLASHSMSSREIGFHNELSPAPATSGCETG
jgi:DNA-binding CsgD family transcriptional regulator